MISIAMAISLTGWSKRTLWRRISDGTLTRGHDKVVKHNKTQIQLEAIEPHFCVPIEPDDFDLIEHADSGNVEAQTDLALLFLASAKPESAIYWLELAAKRDHTNAMYLLGRCYIDGEGVLKNEDRGIMWIAKAASEGHMIAQGLTKKMREVLLEITKT